MTVIRTGKRIRLGFTALRHVRIERENAKKKVPAAMRQLESAVAERAREV